MKEDGLDPGRIALAMKEAGIANANQLAIKCHVNRATAIRWTRGQMPTGNNVGVLTSVLQKSLPWLRGAPIPSNQRQLIATAVRAELGQDGVCPEADLIEAFGAFSFEQRQLLVQVILRGAVPNIEGIAPIADAKPPKLQHEVTSRAARRKHTK